MELKFDSKTAGNVKSLPDLRRALKGFEDQIPLAAAQSITFTAERVQTDLKEVMARVFDRPTRFTLNSVRKTAATPRKLFAEVMLKDEISQGTPAARYLQPQIEGGNRPHKATERNLLRNGLINRNQYLVPGDDVRLNRYGNITRGQIVKALSNIGGHLDGQQNTTSDAARGRQKRSGRQYFWLPGKGIYWRQSKKSIRSFMVVASKPDYDKRFDFFGEAIKSYEKHLPEQMERSINRVLRKMAGEGG